MNSSDMDFKIDVESLVKEYLQNSLSVELEFNPVYKSYGYQEEASLKVTVKLNGQDVSSDLVNITIKDLV